MIDMECRRGMKVKLKDSGKEGTIKAILVRVKMDDGERRVALPEDMEMVDIGGLMY